MSRDHILQVQLAVHICVLVYYNASLLGLGFWYLRVFGYTVIYIDVDIPEGSFI